MSESFSLNDQGRVLIVEDDQEVRRALTLLLRARGYALDVFRSGHELLATQISAAQSDCLLIDYKLPKIDGLKLLKRLREVGVKTPAYLITGYSSSTLNARALAAGFESVIEKPASGDELAELIGQSRALQRH